MEVQFADSFTKSLKRLLWHEHWLYKTYSFFRWDIWHFFKNIWRFRKELWEHQWWDYRFTLNMLERSLSILEKGITEKGLEVSESREPKLKAMRRALELLRNNRRDNYIDRAERELGLLTRWEMEFEELETGGYRLKDDQTDDERAHDREVFERAREIEEEEWKELWSIIKGTRYSKKFGKKYDGTDLRGWWD